ncbi:MULTISPECIES: 50S ribosomal protein L15 [unclassified Wenzhouxiangella]|uniref:50S ribosomal protein L15 n=1 Tax=unclassified Wenzhouxiangella TaxID=2613841 RepID=UPI000E328A3E|nr:MULTISPECIES: 50S ribosomal protein L15 [unclassified Wenzhouxiangella]RFF26457.1 50S ribosomal protein L15 [Wenzhouxiangella sp. 15181]RFP67270.1 50S ribosomal protein L15 [Wenzhouxiangella sp. 15190]
MKLNSIQPVEGSRSERKRVGRGIGSGLGKTGGRGHKGQKARSGGYHKVGFEGGQMPLQRRVPKVGFRSAVNRHTAELRLYQINVIDADVIDLDSLKSAGLIADVTRKVRLVNTGAIERAVTVRGIHVTAGAAKAIEAAGGKVE